MEFLREENPRIGAYEVENLLNAQVAITTQMLGIITREQFRESLVGLGLTGIINHLRTEDLDLENSNLVQRYHLEGIKRWKVQEEAIKKQGFYKKPGFGNGRGGKRNNRGGYRGRGGRGFNKRGRGWGRGRGGYQKPNYLKKENKG